MSLLQKLQSFSAYLWGKGGQSSDVSTRSRKAGDEPVGNRIAILRHDNGNRSCRFLGGDGLRAGPPVTMTSTLRRTSSAASAGRRSSFPSAYRYSMTMFFPSTYPSSRRPWRNASTRAEVSGRDC